MTTLADAGIMSANLSTDTHVATGFTSSSVNDKNQVTRPILIEGLHANDGITGESYVRRFKSMYAAMPPKPEVMATASR